MFSDWMLLWLAARSFVVFVIKDTVVLRSHVYAPPGAHSITPAIPKKAFPQPFDSWLCSPSFWQNAASDARLWALLIPLKDVVLSKSLLVISLGSFIFILIFSTQSLNMNVVWAPFPWPLPSIYCIPEWFHLLLSTEDFKSWSAPKPLSCAPNSSS